MTSDEFTHIVEEWIATARHPKTGKLYTEMVYQPMLELLTYLRARGFNFTRHLVHCRHNFRVMNTLNGSFV